MRPTTVFTIIAIQIVSTAFGLQPLFQIRQPKSTSIVRQYHKTVDNRFLSEGARTETTNKGFLLARRHGIPHTAPLMATSNEGDNADNRSLLQILNDLGQSFKVRAQRASQRAGETDKKGRKLLNVLQACCFYTLFIMYRGYRGFFILLPALFRSVYSKLMKTDLLESFNDDNVNGNGDGGGSGAVSKTKEWTTRVTVFVLASVVTMAYVLGGFLRVVTQFLRTIIKTSSVRKSFEAAADEMVSHESKISRISSSKEKKDDSQLSP